MRRRSGLFSLILLLLIPGLTHAQERITSFDTRIVVGKDSSLTVTETIALVSTGNQISYGIYRDFQTKYPTRLGKVTTVGLDIQSVSRDGNPEPFNVVGEDDGERVYIGDPNRSLERGHHEYAITYTTTRRLYVGKDRDELGWNVTGYQWPFRIEKATAEVILPPGVPIGEVTARSYAGPKDSKSNTAKQKIIVGPPTVVFATTQFLQEHEGLTIDVTWPKGFVKPPTSAQNRAYFLQDNRAPILGLLGLAAVLSFYLIAWSRVGKDPPSATVVPRWEIPDDLSPAAIRFVRRAGNVDNKMLSVALVNMAAKRYVKVAREGDVYRVKKDQVNDSVLSPEELAAVKALLGDQNSIALDYAHRETILDAKRKISTVLYPGCCPKYFRRNDGYVSAGILTCCAIVVPMEIWIARLAPAILGLFAAMYVIVNVVFFRLLTKYTVQGRQLLDKIEGLRIYLATAEQDRLNDLNPHEKTPEIFEKFLPYALALDVEEKWAEKFSGVVWKAIEWPDK